MGVKGAPVLHPVRGIGDVDADLKQGLAVQRHHVQGVVEIACGCRVNAENGQVSEVAPTGQGLLDARLALHLVRAALSQGIWRGLTLRYGVFHEDRRNVRLRAVAPAKVTQLRSFGEAVARQPLVMDGCHKELGNLLADPALGEVLVGFAGPRGDFRNHHVALLAFLATAGLKPEFGRQLVHKPPLCGLQCRLQGKRLLLRICHECLQPAAQQLSLLRIHVGEAVHGALASLLLGQ
mmetsp:Transcript_77216/g.230025  ORF Transcript_77216/g.230025 Transcript_77216/m.230025 type:complete len:236 (+) Transcript_77216:1608-2315(+)